MIDLGVMPKKEESGKDCCASPCSPGNSDRENQPSYPTLTIDGAENVDKILKSFKIENGAEVTATVRFRVSGFQDTKWSKSLSFDVKSIDSIAAAKDDTEATPKKSKAMSKILDK